MIGISSVTVSHRSVSALLAPAGNSRRRGSGGSVDSDTAEITDTVSQRLNSRRPCLRSERPCLLYERLCLQPKRIYVFSLNVRVSPQNVCVFLSGSLSSHWKFMFSLWMTKSSLKSLCLRSEHPCPHSKRLCLCLKRPNLHSIRLRLYLNVRTSTLNVSVSHLNVRVSTLSPLIYLIATRVSWSGSQSINSPSQTYSGLSSLPSCAVFHHTPAVLTGGRGSNIFAKSVKKMRQDKQYRYDYWR